MKILYIFPHPDDETFGPAPVIRQQANAGHEIGLITLTKGGATRERHKFGYSVEAMGDVRVAELKEVISLLGINHYVQWDLEDGGLEALNPVWLEAQLEAEISLWKPDILVTYPVHGISGHHDHLVIHAVVKHLYCRLQADNIPWCPSRLAFFTLPAQDLEKEKVGNPNARFSKPEHVDCICKLSDADIELLKTALNCYKTYKEVIERYDVVNHIGREVHFECFGEDHKPPLTDLCEALVPVKGNLK